MRERVTKSWFDSFGIRFEVETVQVVYTIDFPLPDLHFLGTELL